MNATEGTRPPSSPRGPVESRDSRPAAPSWRNLSRRELADALHDAGRSWIAARNLAEMRYLPGIAIVIDGVLGQDGAA